jgi:hypothetical protein
MGRGEEADRELLRLVPADNMSSGLSCEKLFSLIFQARAPFHDQTLFKTRTGILELYSQMRYEQL